MFRDLVNQFKQDRVSQIMLFGGLVIIFCIGCVLFAAIARRNQPQVVGQPTAPPVDTPTLETESIPSSKPEEILAYTQQVGGIMQDLASELGGLGREMSNPQLTNEDWIIRAASHAGGIKAAHQRLELLDPPPEFADLHARLLDATGDCSNSTDHLAAGIDNRDAGELQTAIDLQNSCSQKINNLSETIDTLLTN